MKLLVALIAVLFAVVSATLYLAANSGYVLIARETWSVEMSLGVFAVLLVATVAAGYALIRGALRLWNAPRDVARVRAARRRADSRAALTDGILRLAEGRYAEAEKHVLSDLAGAEAPVAHYLVAARAAAGRGDRVARDGHLVNARRVGGDHAFAVDMAQAQLLYEGREYERALTALTGLRTRQPRDTQVAALLARVYEKLKDWDSLARLVHDLRRRRTLPAGALDELEITARRELLRLDLPTSATDVLHRAWSSLSPGLRQRADFVAIHARHLMRHGATDEAAALLKSAIDHEWNAELVQLYGLAHVVDAHAQWQTAEQWARRHREDAALLLTLGRIAARLPDTARARTYFERARTAGAQDAAHELARLLAESGDRDAALAMLLEAGDISDAGGGTPAPGRAPVHSGRG